MISIVSFSPCVVCIETYHLYQERWFARMRVSCCNIIEYHWFVGLWRRLFSCMEFWLGKWKIRWLCFMLRLLTL